MANKMNNPTPTPQGEKVNEKHVEILKKHCGHLEPGLVSVTRALDSLAELDTLHQSEMEKLRRENEWISVTDRLPEKNEWVLIFSDYASTCMYLSPHWINEKPTHWKLLSTPF